MVKKNGDSFVARTYTKANGLAQNSVYSVHRNRDGTVWAGTVSAGASRFKDGKFTNYSIVDGLKSDAIKSIVEGHDGTMWFATPNGLASFNGGRWRNRTASDGLPSSDARSIFEDSRQILWIATSSGLAFLSSDHVGVPRKLPESLHEEVLGITEDKSGFLWLATSDHVLKVDRDRILTGAVDTSDTQTYGNEDGLIRDEGVRRDRSMVTDTLGRVWVSLNRGLAVADPEAILRDSVPVMVRIESITAGGQKVNLNDQLKFAAGSQNINFHYASTSLSMPELVRFRYKLDGYDPGWSDVVASRQAHVQPSGSGVLSFSHRRIQPRRSMEWSRDHNPICCRAGLLADLVVSSFVFGALRSYYHGSPSSPHLPTDPAIEHAIPGAACGTNTHRAGAARHLVTGFCQRVHATRCCGGSIT